MHELPLVQAVIDKAGRHALARKGRCVRSVTLVVGDGSGYVPGSIQMYFGIAAVGTPCEGAVLRIRRVKPLMLCTACGGKFERKPFTFDCPACGGEGVPADEGRELYIEDIEIEPEEEDHEENDPCAGDGGNPHRE